MATGKWQIPRYQRPHTGLTTPGINAFDYLQIMYCQKLGSLTKAKVVQDHPRSMILVPIESTYATSYYSVIVTMVLSCTMNGQYALLCRKDASIGAHCTNMNEDKPIHAATKM